MLQLLKCQHVPHQRHKILRVREDGLQQQGQFYKYWPFYTRVHRYTCNECWRRVNASACSGGVREERKQRSCNKHTLSRGVMEGGVKNVFIPSAPPSLPPSSSTHSPTHPLLSPLPHYLHSGKSADKRDNPPVAELLSPNLGWRSLMAA